MNIIWIDRFMKLRLLMNNGCRCALKPTATQGALGLVFRRLAVIVSVLAAWITRLQLSLWHLHVGHLSGRLWKWTSVWRTHNHETAKYWSLYNHHQIILIHPYQENGNDIKNLLLYQTTSYTCTAYCWLDFRKGTLNIKIKIVTYQKTIKFK